MSESTAKPTPNKPAKNENMFANILINVVVPTLILMKLSGEDKLGPTFALVLALAFPVGYGVVEYLKTRKLNFFSALGVVSVMLTGGMALLKLPPEYIAIKEAAIPALFGIAVLGSLKTRYPLIKTFMFNPTLMQVDKIRDALTAHNAHQAFERTLTVTSCLLAASFFLSSVLNYGLAKYLLVSEPGTEAFNAELGKMTAMSFPVITIPSMIVFIAAMFYLFSQIKKHTGMGLDDMMISPEIKK
ncbi:MAG: VC0807 family protein [Marinagarivorans sp.]|nr:VC0807 family protein [Marinagarivorans sp.]